MQTSRWYLGIVSLILMLMYTASQTVEADARSNNTLDVPPWVTNWLGYDTSAMSNDEFDSMICIASGLTMGVLITIVGGTAIVISGSVGRAAGTAIALPVLVSSMWSACALSRAVTPGLLWLHNRSGQLVKKLSG